MARQRNQIPSYLHHSRTNRARAVWTDSSGNRYFRLLPGAYDSPESRTAYATLLLELQAAPHQSQVRNGTGITIAELLLAFLDHAEQHYRGIDGKPTSEIYEVKVVIRALRELYAEKCVSEFGPLCVKAARQKWINDGRSRTECNRRVSMIKRIFKWAVSEELVPAAVYQAVATVSALQKGRTPASETKPIAPVGDEVVDATLPFLSREVAGLVEFQRLTGCRPGEACALRRCDIDMTGPTWFYTPSCHKNAYRGIARSIAIGPRAQAIIQEFFTAAAEDYLFNPARAVAEKFAASSRNRKTPRWRSHTLNNAKRRKPDPKRIPSKRYVTEAYGRAVARACERAFPLPTSLDQSHHESQAAWWARLSEADKEAVKAWRQAHRWHPNQLRHSFATRVRKQHGLEAAQVLLGHTSADVTQIYAERNQGLAAAVAAQIG